MKWIGFAMFAVLVLDGFAYSLLHPAFAVVPASALGAVVWVSMRRRQPVVEESGWHIGEGEEITDPERPVAMPRIVIPSKTLGLGVLGIGSPGAGKTESLMIGLLHHYSSLEDRIGWAAFDGKGQIDVFQKAVAVGAAPDFFFSSELPGSHTINLMDGNPEDVADRLSKVLIGESFSTTFYADEQRSVLLTVIPLLLGLGLRANLRDLYVALSHEDAGRELLLLAQQRGVDEAVYRAASAWYEMDFGTRVANIKGMLNRLFVFVSGPYADRLNDYYPDIDLVRDVEEGRRIYFHLPESRFSKDVAVMVIEQLASIAKRRQQDDLEKARLYPLLFDDWGALFHPGFKPFSARCRSAKMPLSFFFQSRAQLQDVSPTYETELDDNIATKVLMRINGQDTAELGARLMGTYETREVGLSFLGDHDGTSINVRETGRLRPADFKALDPGEAFVSTLVTVDGDTRNALYRTRFPRNVLDGWADVPVPSSSKPVVDYMEDGLNFWRRFMTPEQVQTLAVASA